jgi:hypothetical protein
MSEAVLSERPAVSDRRSIGQRKDELTRTLEAKAAQGNKVESRTDTQAVLRMGARRRWFGLVAGTVSTYDVAVDERGHTSSRRRA